MSSEAGLQAQVKILTAKIAVQQATIADLEAKLADLTTKDEHLIFTAQKPSRMASGPYLSTKIYYKWTEEKLLLLLAAVEHVMLTPETADLSGVLARYVSNTTESRVPSIDEVEYALGKIYHDEHRVSTKSICTPAINQYIRDHESITTFFRLNLAEAPYFGPN